MPTDPTDPPQYVAEMTSEHPAVGVQFVNDDVAQILEQLGPARMVRQDPRVQHVRIAEHKVRARPNRSACILRRVAVVGEHSDLVAVDGKHFTNRMQLGKLSVGERLGWKQIQRAARWILEHRIEYRSVVAKRLPGRRWCDDDDIAPSQRMSDRFGLVRVELRDSPRAERIPQAAIERLGERRVSRRYWRYAAQRGAPQIRPICHVGTSA